MDLRLLIAKVQMSGSGRRGGTSGWSKQAGSDISMQGKLHHSHAELVGSLDPSLTFPELNDGRARRERNVARLRLLCEQRQSILRSTMAGRVLTAMIAFLIPKRFESNYPIAAAVQILFEPHKLFQHSAATALGAALRTGDRP